MNSITGARLLAHEVVDVDGASVGLVRDVRLTRDADTWSATGLVVGRRLLSERLGYAHGVVAGPALLAWWLRRRHSHLRWVPWDLVSAVDEGEVRLSCRRDELEPVLEARR